MHWPKCINRPMTVCMALYILLIFGCTQGVVYSEDVEKAIKSKIPIGSSKEEVLNFINTASFKSLKFQRPFKVVNIKEVNPEADENIKECIAAWIFDVEQHVFEFGTENILVVFCFDKSQKFSSYKISRLRSE